MRSLARRLMNSLIRASLDALHLQSEFINSARDVSAILKATQRSLLFQYRSAMRSGEGLPSISDTGFRVYSQNDEDGLLLFVFAAVGAPHKTFVEIGTEDGIECNCANLAINFGWRGLFVDADQASVDAGRKFYASHPDTDTYPPKFVCARVTKENVNAVLEGAGFRGEIDLLSIDIDGNDYWIWEAINCISPRVVIIETHVELGMRSMVSPYDPEFKRSGNDGDAYGASPLAMTKLANRLGYRLVGANLYGFNAIYVRKDIGVDVLPEVPVEKVLAHPRNRERGSAFDARPHRPYVEV